VRGVPERPTALTPHRTVSRRSGNVLVFGPGAASTRRANLAAGTGLYPCENSVDSADLPAEYPGAYQRPQYWEVYHARCYSTGRAQLFSISIAPEDTPKVDGDIWRGATPRHAVRRRRDPAAGPRRRRPAEERRYHGHAGSPG